MNLQQSLESTKKAQSDSTTSVQTLKEEISGRMETLSKDVDEKIAPIQSQVQQNAGDVKDLKEGIDSSQKSIQEELSQKLQQLSTSLKADLDAGDSNVDAKISALAEKLKETVQENGSVVGELNSQLKRAFADLEAFQQALGLVQKENEKIGAIETTVKEMRTNLDSIGTTSIGRIENFGNQLSQLQHYFTQVCHL